MSEKQNARKFNKVEQPILSLSSKPSKRGKKKSQSCQKPELYPGTKFQKQKDTFKKNVTGERTRRVAFDILLQVERGIKLSDALSSCLDLLKLEQRDRRFVRLLVTSVLRQRGQLERIISSLIKRRPFGSQANANLILLIGAAQAVLLKKEAYASVNSTVELMREVGFDHLCGLTNAVMRRITREGESLLQGTTHKDNLPLWLQKSWAHYWGKEASGKISQLMMTAPPLDISVRRDAKVWAKKLDAIHVNHHSLRRKFDGDLTQLDGFKEGDWWVQDVAAALPAKLLNATSNDSVIDLCAAPGGKTAQLISTGAKVIAVEKNQKRINQLEKNLKRLKLKADLVLADGTKFRPKHPVDLVLLDAPCSGTGTIRRRPDILNHRVAANITLLQKIQWQLLTSALDWLKPGGKLIFSTCSLQPEEGEDVVKTVIQEAEKRYQIDCIEPNEAGIFSKSIDKIGCLRILPSDYEEIGGVDGFFIARIIRTQP